MRERENYSTTERPLRALLKGFLEHSWLHRGILGRIEAIWGRLAVIFGRLEAILGPTWAILEASWANLEASLRHLGVIMGRTWGQHGA